MERKYYADFERTNAQFKAMQYKQRGYQVVRLIDPTKVDEVVAFGYKKSTTSYVKKATEMNYNLAREQDFAFIYWN